MSRSDRRIYRTFVRLLGQHRRRLVMMLGASIAGPFLLAARIWLLKVLIDGVLRAHRPSLLPAVAGAFVATSLARAGLDSVRTSAGGSIGTEISFELRSRCYAALQARTMTWFRQQRLGDLLTRLSVDIAAIEDLLVSGLTALVTHVVTLAIFLTLLVALDPGLVLVAASVLPALVVVTVLDARRGRRVQEQVRQTTSELTSTAEEGLSAVALVKAFARGEHEVRRFGRAARDSADARLRMVGLRALFPPAAELVSGLGTAAVVWLGAERVLSRHLSLGSLVVFISYLASLYAPIQGLSRTAGSFQRAMVGAERVLEVLDAPASARERSGLPPLPRVAPWIEFDRVSFGYLPGHRVLHEVSFRIEPGELVALVGPSGAGKTTIVSLVLGYYEPDEGAVRLGGRPVAGYDPNSVREQIAAVLQEPMLFDASVQENIRYGCLDAADGEVEWAAEMAVADRFISGLPSGYDMNVGRRGGGLSGGQRQRLAIARALLRRAPVVVLDEPTAALDPDTEAEVMAGIRRACSGSAVLLVAHRDSTIAHADRVLRLDHGRLVEQAPQRAGRRIVKAVP